MKYRNRAELAGVRSNQKDFTAILYPAAINTGNNKTIITTTT
jgi:hypothetical protein